MLLAFDVGNTNIVAGVYEGDRLVQFWRMETSQTKSADEYGITLIELFQNEGISTKDVENIIIATVALTSTNIIMSTTTSTTYGCNFQS